MTISEYLKNPYGKGSAFSSNSKQKEDLDEQFKQLSDRILSKIYRYRDYVIYHVVIPSTKKDSVTYDVVIEVKTQELHTGAANLEDLNFKVFSNCPSFIFTYAHVFRANDMICDWLFSKYNHDVRIKAPTIRNQYGIIGLERSIYLSLKHLHFSGKTKVGVYQTAGKKVSGRTEIINTVRTQQQVMDKVREKIPKEDVADTGKDTQAFTSKTTYTNKHSVEKKNKTIKTTATVKTVKGTKSLKSIKTSKTTKKI